MAGRADYLILGDWNTACYECGRKRKASTMQKHWKGYYVCPEHWEPRQAQDFVRAIAERPAPPWIQPMVDIQGVALCSPNGKTAYPEEAVAGCVICDYIDTGYDPHV